MRDPCRSRREMEVIDSVAQEARSLPQIAHSYRAARGCSCLSESSQSPRPYAIAQEVRESRQPTIEENQQKLGSPVKTVVVTPPFRIVLAGVARIGRTFPLDL